MQSSPLLIVVAAILPSLIILGRTPAYTVFRLTGALFAGFASLGWIIERLFGVDYSVDLDVNRLAQCGLWIALSLFVISLIEWWRYEMAKHGTITEQAPSVATEVNGKGHSPKKHFYTNFLFCIPPLYATIETRRHRMFAKPTLVFVALLTFAGVISLQAQGLGQGPGPARQAPPPTAGAKLDIIEDGSSATYRVTEQFVGVTFTNEAVGTTNLVSGTLTILPDGTIGPGSKLAVDLRGLKSDQDMRDAAVQNRVLETAKYPYAEFVPTKIEGLEKMIPSAGQAGVSLTGNLTVHGVTKEVTFQGIATFNPRNNTVAGRAKTTLTFDQFGMKPPKIARLASLDDKIDLELVYRFKRSLP